MAKLPEHYKRECNGGLRRYTTEEYGMCAIDCMAFGAEYAERKRQRMINLEALNARGFKWDGIRDLYYAIITIVSKDGHDIGKRQEIKVDRHAIEDIPNLYIMLDEKLKHVNGEWHHTPKQKRIKTVDNEDGTVTIQRIRPNDLQDN